jgi:hypothetical protein
MLDTNQMFQDSRTRTSVGDAGLNAICMAVLQSDFVTAAKDLSIGLSQACKISDETMRASAFNSLFNSSSLIVKSSNESDEVSPDAGLVENFIKRITDEAVSQGISLRAEHS